jgi:hypothetical protein
LSADDFNAPPAAPDNLRWSLVDADHFVLEWDDNSNNERWFVLNDGSTDYTYGASITTSQQFSLAEGSGKNYKVKAKNDFGESAWSASFWVADFASIGTVTIAIAAYGSDPDVGSQTLAKGTTGIFTTSITDGESYEWYINGALIPDVTGSSFSFETTDRDAGVYELAVVMLKNGHKLSGRCSVTVTN